MMLQPDRPTVSSLCDLDDAGCVRGEFDLPLKEMPQDIEPKIECYECETSGQNCLAHRDGA